MKKSLLAAALTIVVAAFTSTGYAAYTTIPLEGLLSFPDAKGNVEISYSDIVLNVNEVTVDVSGLKPNAVYTVWLTREAPSRLKGLGVGDYAFRTDAAGNGRFVASVPDGEMLRWDVIEIAHHPNGGPADLDNAQVALRGDLG